MSSTKEVEKTCFANLNQRIKMWRVFDQPIATFVYLFVRYENFTLYHKKKASLRRSLRSLWNVSRFANESFC